MALRNSGVHANMGRASSIASIERARHILSVAKQHVPHLVIDGARVDMPKWRDLVRGNIADLASRGQPLDEEIMRNYFPDLVDQAVCIHGSWTATIKDYNKNKLIEFKKIAGARAITEVTPRKQEIPLTPARKKRRERVIEAILLYDGVRANLRLSAMLRLHPKLVKDGIAEFGTWKRAVEAAGLNYSNYGPYAEWEEEKFLAKGKALMEEDRHLKRKGKEKQFDLVRFFIDEIDFATALYERFNNWDEYESAVEKYVPPPSPDNTDETPEPEQGPEA